MIKSIVMKKCATYSEEGAIIDNCPKINFFYGANGSGKSTIGNYLQNQSDNSYSSCQINWEADTPTEIIVYNREFRRRNFKENIAGVFTLGQATIEEIKALDEMKEERERKKAELTTRRTTLQNTLAEELTLKETFKKNVWNKIFKPNDDDFQEAFSGSRNSQEKFMQQILSRHAHPHSSTETRASLKLRAATLFTTKPERCSMFPLEYDALIHELTLIENDAIWNKIIIGNKDLPIAKLIEHFGNADWINQGREYIDRNGICPFCQQKTLTQEFIGELNSFFSGEYEQDIANLKNLTNRYKTAIETFTALINSALTNEDSIKIGKLDIEKYKILRDSFVASVSTNLTEMVSKQKEAGKKIILIDNSSIIKELLQLLKESNAIISKHNEMVEHYETEKAKLVNDVWDFLLCEHETLISTYIRSSHTLKLKRDGIKGGISTGEHSLSELENKIVEAGKNVTSVQPAVDEINRSLQAYGFTNFQIVSSPVLANSYQIQRLDGELATSTLSEGEETFITFLYFLQFAKGALDVSKVSTKKILVLDDPICSLDSTVLYIVSSMVKSLIKEVRDGHSNVEQLFILTHNVFFHKEASFIDNRAEICNDVNYWIIRKNENITSITAYEKNNPIKTSYELLWQELKDNANASLVTTQNIMRRILENYFSILGKTKDDKIVDSFSTVEDKIICRSLLSWINDGSHSIPDDLYIDSYTDSIDRYKAIFKQIFINMHHEAHYNMMMGIQETVA